MQQGPRSTHSHNAHFKLTHEILSNSLFLRIRKLNFMGVNVGGILQKVY